MKGIYKADPITHAFVSSDVVADDYQLQANESFENPSVNVMPAKLVNGAWVDATPEEAAAYQKEQMAKYPDPVAPSGPSQDAQAVNALGLQLAQIKANQAAMTTAMDALGMTVATIKAAQATPTTTTPTATN